MLLTVEPRHFEDNPAKQYIVVDARVEALSVILEKAPDLLRKPIDPTELDRLRFVLILQTPTGGVRRMRMVQWNDSAIQRFREVDKEGSRLLSEGFAEALMWSVQESTPRQCEKNLGISRRR
ncbi:hypothetical protein H0H93_001356 [Arthromyces matolae]|nr:hypothetical protein H0H93_001356 [Arthromyces matolae]